VPPNNRRDAPYQEQLLALRYLHTLFAAVLINMTLATIIEIGPAFIGLYSYSDPLTPSSCLSSSLSLFVRQVLVPGMKNR
jgi:type IV secretory pathway TrbL component